MTSPDHKHTPRPWAPWWVWLTACLLGLLQPITLLLIRNAPPAGMTPTGMHIPDSALFIQAMSMFDDGFESHYATILAPNGLHDPAYFAIPHLWFYGLQGAMAHALHADYFLFYGVCNGIAAIVCYMSLYRFFRAAAPFVANSAFLLFALGGGVGGVLFFATAFAGLHESPHFESYFWRFAVYELVEGAHLFPVTYLGRSYYTLSLAACFSALTVLMHALRMRCSAHGMLAAIILFAGAFLNARFGLFTLGIAACYVTNRTLRGEKVPFNIGFPFIVGGAAGWLASWALMNTSSVMIRNHVDVGNMSMQFSPFVVTALWVLPLCLFDAYSRMRTMPVMPRMLTGAALGYLGAFALLFAAYQTYYGNWLIARDSVVASAISDWALAGAIPAALLSMSRRRENHGTPYAWITIWMLGFLCLAISAFGQGWFLRFGPQRLMVMLFPAMCISAALALQRIATGRPRLARTYVAGVCGCGIVTIAVSAFCFQAPLGRKPNPQAFDETQTAVITDADARLIDAIPPNEEGLAWIPAVVMAPLPASDVVAMRRGNSVAFGIGTFNMSDQPYLPLRMINEMFFSDLIGDGARISILHTLRVHYVFCPDTWPVSEATQRALDRCEYLDPVAEAGRGKLYRVDYAIVEKLRGYVGAFQASTADELLANVLRTREGPVL